MIGYSEAVRTRQRDRAHRLKGEPAIEAIWVSADSFHETPVASKRVVAGTPGRKPS